MEITAKIRKQDKNSKSWIIKIPKDVTEFLKTQGFQENKYYKITIQQIVPN